MVAILPPSLSQLLLKLTKHFEIYYLITLFIIINIVKNENTKKSFFFATACFEFRLSLYPSGFHTPRHSSK